jgi:carbon-monoxide dehydrogenase large subunit
MGSPSPLNPLGVKGVGECGVMPALRHRASDALRPGVRIARTPVTPAEIVASVQSARLREKNLAATL